MSASSRRREILLSTAALLGALAVYGRDASASPNCSPDALTITCSGGPFSSPETAYYGPSVTVTVDDAVEPFFQIDTSGYSPELGAFSIVSFGDTAFIDPFTESYVRTTNADNAALRIRSALPGSGTPTASDVYVNAYGSFYGGTHGILVQNENDGGIDVRAYGARIQGEREDGISATISDSLSTNNLEITTGTATMVDGAQYGIRAYNHGRGATTITANGSVAGGLVDGIKAQNGTNIEPRGTDITVTTEGRVEGYESGVFTRNYGSGATVIAARGETTGMNYYGIGVYNASSASNIRVTTGKSAAITGGRRGIAARNSGGGFTRITADGDVTGEDDDGIYAFNDFSAGDLAVTTGNASTVTGRKNGINTWNFGGESTRVVARGKVYGTDTGSFGIYARNGDSLTSAGTDLNVTTGANTKVEGAGAGIVTGNYGSGVTNIRVNGSVTGMEDSGIRASGGGNAITIALGSNSTVASNGIQPNNFGIKTENGATTLTVAGALKGGAGGAVRFDRATGFDDRLELQPTAAITGDVRAGLGMDTLAFGGSGNGAFNLSRIGAQFLEFETFQQESGTWRFSGSTSDAFTVNGGVLEGTGTFGSLTVNGGTLAPGNSIGTMRVNGAFSLGGGAVYEVEVNAAGQSDSVLVKGTVNLTGATLRVMAADGDYKPSTDYVIIDNDGNDKVKGRFARVEEDLAFLRPSVVYQGGDGNDVVLTLIRDHGNNNGGGPSFCSVAQTINECNVARALDQFPTSNPLFLSVLSQTAEGARQAFNALSGEVHATVAGTLVDDSRYAREAVLGRMMQASHQGGALRAGGPQVASYDSQVMMLSRSDAYDGKSLAEAPQSQPLAFWTEGYGAWGTFDGDGNAATADRNLGGFISGMDADVWNGWRVGIATGASFSDVSVDQRYSGANTKTYHLGGYVNGDLGGFALRGGGLWAWSEVETSRAVVFPNFYERQKADYDADTGQLFGEVAYPTQMGGVELEPFAGLAYVSVETSGFREKGGAQASLRTSGFDQDVGYTTVGLRAAKTMMWGNMAVTPNIEAAWLHAFDDVTSSASLAFATTGIGFAIDGVPLAEDSAILDAGLDFAITERLTAGVSYTGQWADSVSDNGVKGRLTFLFN